MILSRLKVLFSLLDYQAVDAHLTDKDAVWFKSKGFATKHITEDTYAIAFTRYLLNQHELRR